MNKTNKGMLAFFICFSLIGLSSLGLGWLSNAIVYDNEDDLRRFSYDFYNDFDISINEDPVDELNNMSTEFKENWYNSEHSSALTTAEKDDFGWVDVKQVQAEGIDDGNLTLRIILNGDLEEADVWVCFLWSESSDGVSKNDMLLAIVKSGDSYYVLDHKNEEIYEAEWIKNSYTLKSEFDHSVWNGDDVRFMSIGYKDFGSEKSDVIVDIYPDSVNWNYLWFGLFIIILIAIIALLIYLIYKSNQRM